MPLKSRIIRVSLTFAGGDVIVLDERLMLRVNIRKAALAVQNSAQIEVGGMTQTLREEMLSRFNVFENRVLNQSAANQEQEQLAICNVQIDAGYSVGGVETVSTVFRGQVALAHISMPPPNLVMIIACYTRQVDRSSFSVVKPAETLTLERYVAWVAQQMGFGDRFVVDTDNKDMPITNAGTNVYSVSSLLIDLQNINSTNVVAYVDDDMLIVKDVRKAIDPSNVPVFSQFTSMPVWTEWGVEYRMLFDSNVRLGQAAEIHSTMNQSIKNQFVNFRVEYELASRDIPFYVKGEAAPPA